MPDLPDHDVERVGAAQEAERRRAPDADPAPQLEQAPVVGAQLEPLGDAVDRRLPAAEHEVDRRQMEVVVGFLGLRRNPGQLVHWRTT